MVSSLSKEIRSYPVEFLIEPPNCQGWCDGVCFGQLWVVYSLQLSLSVCSEVVCVCTVL